MERMTIEEKLMQLGLRLPPAPPVGGVYHPIVRQGSLIYISGQGPVNQDGTLIKGKVGRDMDTGAGKLAARQVGLTMLATLKAYFGPLDDILRLIKLFGMVNCTADFQQQPEVINGCSELFAELWGPQHGVGVRSAVGMGSLPGNIPVEIEAVFEAA
ncbi:MAG TPA: RidA family protein [Chitinophagaceae bacterium]|jgi:enamine deaminase RidA (YjgF/YER057c/UK114 family)|nr:RidA family protein [Chitinophagaceae bacterium]